MNLYTLICDFDGGTYLRQIPADDPGSAFEILRDTQEIAGKKLDHDEEVDPVAIDGLSACWCQATAIDDKLCLIHIVETAIS